MTAAAAVAPKPMRRETRLSYNFTPIPSTFFRDSARNLTLCQLLVVGLVQELCAEARSEDVVISAEKLAKWSGQSERNVQSALSSLDKVGVIRRRDAGRGRMAYGFDRSALPALEPRGPRQVERKDPARETAPVLFPAEIACPSGHVCPVEKLTEREDGVLVTIAAFAASKGFTVLEGSREKRSAGRGLTSEYYEAEFTPPPQMRGEAEFTPNKRRKGEDEAKIDPRIRHAAEHFVKRLGVGPGEDILLEIQAALGEATAEQFEAAVAAKERKVQSYKFLVLLARECHETRAAWERKHQPMAAATAPRPQEPADSLPHWICPGLEGKGCGKQKDTGARLCDECVALARAG